MNTMTVNRQTLQGFLFGFLVVLSVWNAYFIILAFIICLLFSGYARLTSKTKLFLLVLTFVNVSYIALTAYLIKGYDLSFTINEVGKLLIFVFFIFIKKNRFFLKGLSLCIYLLFSLDFISNMSQLLLGHDLFGSYLNARSDDLLLSRYVGITGNSYYSISITLVTFIYALINKNKFFICASLLIIMTNSSLKALMYLCFIVSAFVFIRLFNSRLVHYLCLFLFVFLFVVLIYVSLTFLSENSGNYYRMFAYGNGVTIIATNPLFGGGPFDTSGLVGVNEVNLLSHGSTESAFLHYGAFYGFLPMLISFYWLTLLIKHKYNEFYCSESRTKRIEYILSLFLLFDLFLGSFFGSTLVIATLGYILLANDKELVTNYKKINITNRFETLKASKCLE